MACSVRGMMKRGASGSLRLVPFAQCSRLDRRYSLDLDNIDEANSSVSGTRTTRSELSPDRVSGEGKDSAAWPFLATCGKVLASGRQRRFDKPARRKLLQRCGPTCATGIDLPARVDVTKWHLDHDQSFPTHVRPDRVIRAPATAPSRAR